jgi:hypothetical protein
VSKPSSVARRGDQKDAFSVAVLERNFEDLPKETNIRFLNKSAENIRVELRSRCGDDVEAKLKVLKVWMQNFAEGKVSKNMFCKENGLALAIVFRELSVQFDAGKVMTTKGGF